MARSLEARVRRTPPSTTAAAPRTERSASREYYAPPPEVVPRGTRKRSPGVGAAAARAATPEAFRRDRTTAWRARRHTPALEHAAARGSTARDALAVASVADIPIDTHVIRQCRDSADIIRSSARCDFAPNPHTRTSRPRAIEHEHSWATR
jgi:hypothetical protein